MPLSKTNDEILQKELRKGKRKAFDIVVSKYKDKVFNTAYRYLSDWRDADEIAQECFVLLKTRRKRLKKEYSLQSFIYKLNIELCKNRLKAKPRQDKKNIFNLSRGGKTAIIEKKETEMAIQNAIASLDDVLKDAVILRDIEGLPFEDIVALTGRSLETVKENLHAARLTLREKLGELL